MTLASQRISDQRGFSMLEVLVASAILALMMVGVFTLLAANQESYRKGLNRADAQQNGRIALQGMGREIRMAGYDLSDVISTLAIPQSFQVANQNELTFVADVSGDGVLDQVTYKLLGPRLIREISSWDGSAFPAPVSGEVAGGVSVLRFTYLDDSTPTNNVIAAPVGAASLGDIHRVTISLLTTQSAVGNQETFPLVLDLQVRN